MKTRIKRKMDWQNHWELIVQPFLDAYMHFEWCESEEIGCRMS